ncbi:hypothetical protein I79_026124 [Cricetulus griseus]|uniref:Uncharacterized protein n=1 Tax=Cricetulus griseus TaxID=10029 RepID=G3IQ36_CRIGR|nr:hypothetical protein I79_026124 [Cricetulus griseus]
MKPFASVWLSVGRIPYTYSKSVSREAEGRRLSRKGRLISNSKEQCEFVPG